MNPMNNNSKIEKDDIKNLIENNRDNFKNTFGPSEFDDFVLELKQYHGVIKMIDQSWPEMSGYSKCDWGVHI